MTTKNRRVSSLDWINLATLSVRIFLCLTCCRCKECRFSSAAKSTGVHPSNRFAFLARIPFCRANTDTSSLRSAENNLCRTDSLPILFLLNAISRLRKRSNIYSKPYYFFSYKDHIFYMEIRKFILKCKKKNEIYFIFEKNICYIFTWHFC